MGELKQVQRWLKCMMSLYRMLSLLDPVKLDKC
jgi:hypothetical protein